MCACATARVAVAPTPFMGRLSALSSVTENLSQCGLCFYREETTSEPSLGHDLAWHPSHHAVISRSLAAPISCIMPRATLITPATTHVCRMLVWKALLHCLLVELGMVLLSSSSSSPSTLLFCHHHHTEQNTDGMTWDLDRKQCSLDV